MEKIMIVEDEAVVADDIKETLVERGYHVTGITASGEEAVALAGVEKPDLILMDLSLPSMDGWEASRKIKSNPDTRHIPIIALTAHVMSGDREKAIKAGCDDYDTKPVELNRLLSKINMLLNN